MAWFGAGLLALLGVVVGKQWESRSGHAAWLREQRLIAYNALLEGAHGVYAYAQDVEKAIRTAAGPEVIDAAKLPMNMHLLALGTAQSRVALLGPESMAAVSYRVQQAFDAVAACAAAGRPLLDECEEILEQGAAEDAFLEAARAVLGEPPPFWKFWG